MAVAVLATASAVVAYRLGYRHGGDAERVCWTLEPAPVEAWLHGEITARRDTKKHPFLKSALVVRGDRSVNSIPVAVSSSPTSPQLAAGTTNNANGQHKLWLGDGPRKDDSFVRYFGQAALAQYQTELADFTRTGGTGKIHFVFHDPVVREYPPSGPREEMELIKHRSLHLLGTRRQSSVDLIDTK